MLCPSISRPIACNIQQNGRLQSSELKKAWKVLSGNPVACRNYLRPGITVPVQNCANQFPSKALDSCNGIKKAANIQQSGSSTHENLYTREDLSDSPYGSDTKASHSLNYAMNSFMKSGICSNKVDLATKVVQPDMRGMQVPCGSFNNDLGSRHALSTDRDKYNDDNRADVIDDDILEVESIDVNQIVMEYYQTNGTPEGSASNHTVFTPVAPRSNVAGPN